MAAYEFDAEEYKKASRPQKEWGNRLIAGMELNGDETVLDLGCGDGALTARLAALVPGGRALGIDASEGMIAAAEKSAGGNLEFLRMNIDDMDFKERFDVIFSNAALHWVKDHDGLIARAFAALKPGGRLYWNFGGEGNCRNFLRAVRETMASEKFAAYFRTFEWPFYMPSEGEYREKMRRPGFREAVVETENADRFFSDAEEMMRWIDNPCLVPFLCAVPAERKGEFRREVVGETLRRARRADGTCFETFRRIRVYAVK